MTSTHIPHGPDGVLARVVRRAAGASARWRKTTLVLWLALVVGCVAAGTMTGTEKLTDAQAGVGQSASADAQIADAGMKDPAVESILVKSSDPARTRAAAADLQRRAAKLPQVSAVHGPADTPALSTAGGRIVLVQAALRGDPDDAGDNVKPLERTVAAVHADHRGVVLQQAGPGSIDKAVNEVVSDDLQHAEVISIPITLLILVLAFGAIVAASVPLLLGITSVAAALGAVGVISQIAPAGDTTTSLVVLIGLAVGVDYSLFYVRREREERRAGRGPHAALDAAAAAVGRAIVVSGLTVMVALAGLLVTGMKVFESMALATIAVVAIAVIGSLTALPAVLAMLGDRVDKGRIPGVKWLRARRARREAAAGQRRGVWAAIARVSTRRPLAAFVTAVCLLGALAVPAMDMRIAGEGVSDFPPDLPVVQANKAIERSFPGAPEDAKLVVTGHRLGASAAQEKLEALGERGMRVTGGHGRVGVDVSRDGRTAVVSVPMPDHGVSAADDTIAALRDRVAPTAAQVQAGAHAQVTGEAARDADFTKRLKDRTPIVIAFVLALAFVLLLAAFRSVPGRGGDRPEPAVGRRRLRRARRGLPAQLGRERAELHLQRLDRQLAAAVLLRDPLRALDGLHGPGARAHPRGAARRALAPRCGGGGRGRHRRHGHERGGGDGGDLRRLRHAAAAVDEAARRRAGGRDPARRDGGARAGAPGRGRPARAPRAARQARAPTRRAARRGAGVRRQGARR
jgi:uncharacterized membrane protein YdfJ with MMPL/SSD domain